MVLHEESNSCYYWNISTGETSWEVPANFVQETVSTNGLENLGREMEERSVRDENNSTALSVKLDDFSASNGLGYSSGNSEMNLVYEQAAPQSESVEYRKGDGDQLLGISPVVGALPHETSSHYLFPQLYSGAAGSLAMGSYDVPSHSAMSTEHGVAAPSQLVKLCEALLQRLNLLQGSGVDADLSAWFQKYISEIEVRLCDIRALLPYGSSVAPFWLHSERQLNQLENAINAVTGKQDIDSCGVHLNLTEPKDANLEGRAERPKGVEDLTKLSPETAGTVMLDADGSRLLQKPLCEKATDVGCLNVPQISASDPESHLKESGNAEINSLHEKASSMLEVQPSEDPGMDVDMDVDMEVEVPSPTRTITTDGGSILLAHSDSSVQPSAPLAGQCPSPESEVVPPPPEEDWIPPPPPDDESIPPPPPDEPPEPLVAPPPPSELEPVPESVQSIYGEHYNLTYAESSVNYYGNTSLVSSGNSFYEHVNGSQIAAVNLPVYYTAVPNPQPATVLTPASTVMYYGLQNGVSPVVPLADSIGSSSTQATANNLNFDAPSTSEITSNGAPMEECATAKLIVDPLSGDKVEMLPSQVSPASAISATASVPVKEHASVSSCSTAATSSTSMNTLAAVSDASAVASKPQSKASRMKKQKVSVASSLRSNKKVSSLVDKWKAAKEELQEQEEEDRETPLEFLEKKRQREIEVWRAQQVASGEAKENANFQPLGGDWRERVKRRRAQKGADPRTSSDAGDDGSKQPDISALSKDLPVGWQAYWDDSSSKVYYSNTLTSETTWTRPTR